MSPQALLSVSQAAGAASTTSDVRHRRGLWPVSVLVLLGLVGGCQSIPPTPQNDPDGNLRQKVLKRQDTYETRGRLSLTTPEATNQASFTLNVDDEDLALQLSGPFGIGAVKLEDMDGQGRIISAKHGDIALQNTEEELTALLGYPVPLNAIRFWALGLAEPGKPAQRTMATDGRLLSVLEQGGWRVEYQQYKSVPIPGRDDEFSVELPRKVVLSSPEVRILMVFRHWRF